jgi:hypothetical protein
LLADPRLDLDQRRRILVPRLAGARLLLGSPPARCLRQKYAGSLKSTRACHIGGSPPWLK